MCVLLLCCLVVGNALVFVLAALVACVLCVLGCIVVFFSVMRLIYVGLFVCVHV